MIENEFEYDFENRISAPEYTPEDVDIEIRSVRNN